MLRSVQFEMTSSPLVLHFIWREENTYKPLLLRAAASLLPLIVLYEAHKDRTEAHCCSAAHREKPQSLTHPSERDEASHIAPHLTI